MSFEEPADVDHGAIDAAYRRKYAHHATYVEAMVSGKAAAATLRLAPRPAPVKEAAAAGATATSLPAGDRKATGDIPTGHGIADGQP